ncbi:MAG: methylmalonyl Co-A mutase-associated GTPase MeaB [Treponema sp.]|nr:methylmalonyl Co-A mutase-associated GTPase MeaB [Treponema sp.]
MDEIPDIRGIARLISMVEEEREERIELLSSLSLKPNLGHIIGITGPPGAGKSTLTDKLVLEFRALGKTVAVIAVDPSSPFSGGAILGDRIRMQRHADDPGVFIRSLATRGHLGGLSRAVRETIRVFEGYGFDVIIVETVGVGQSEVDIARCADTVILVSVPGLGDDIQTMKAGIMEIGDIFVVNKADREGSERVIKEIRVMLEMALSSGAETRFSVMSGSAHHHIVHNAGADNFHPLLPPVLATIAETGEGVKALVKEIIKHGTDLREKNILPLRRNENLEWELKDALKGQLVRKLERENNRALLIDLAGAINDKNISFYDALERLSEAI